MYNLCITISLICFSDFDETTKSKHLKSTYENILNTQREVDEEFAKLRTAKEKRNMRTTQTCVSSWATKYNLQQPEEQSQNSILSGEDNKHKAAKDFEFRIPTLPVKKPGRSSGITGKLVKPCDRSNETILSSNTSRIYSMEPDQASNQPGLFSSISSLYPSELMMSDNSLVKRNAQDVPENLSFSLPGSIETCSSSRLGENHRISWCSSVNSSLGIISPETLEGWWIYINKLGLFLYITYTSVLIASFVVSHSREA